MTTGRISLSNQLPDYAELHALSNFSFQRGASHAHELVVRAAELGYSAIAITDECSVAGVVRAHVAAKQLGFKLLRPFAQAKSPHPCLPPKAGRSKDIESKRCVHTLAQSKKKQKQRRRSKTSLHAKNPCKYQARRSGCSCPACPDCSACFKRSL